ncbi:hypothetical protein EDB84DRAFT_546352 [Lactarius hengduanensis]|nr:hypothetical protein EDB84DRAFT_546352 [Lactarius hengduanensis]
MTPGPHAVSLTAPCDLPGSPVSSRQLNVSCNLSYTRGGHEDFCGRIVHFSTTPVGTATSKECSVTWRQILFRTNRFSMAMLVLRGPRCGLSSFPGLFVCFLNATGFFLVTSCQWRPSLKNLGEHVSVPRLVPYPTPMCGIPAVAREAFAVASATRSLPLNGQAWSASPVVAPMQRVEVTRLHEFGLMSQTNQVTPWGGHRHMVPFLVLLRFPLPNGTKRYSPVRFGVCVSNGVLSQGPTFLGLSTLKT